MIRHGSAREAKAWVAEPARSGCKYVIQPAPQPLRPVRSELRGNCSTIAGLGAPLTGQLICTSSSMKRMR